MAQGKFTKQEAAETRKAVQEMWEALTKAKRMEYFGNLNDIFLFLDAAEFIAPDENAGSTLLSEVSFDPTEDDLPSLTTAEREKILKEAA